MRRLILLRHAKSSWDDPDAPDHDRPLNARGRGAAGVIGGWLAKRGDIPDFVLLSDSARTIETWALARAAMPGAPDAQPTPRLYHADPATMLAVLRTAPANGATSPASARAFTRFPTGAAAILDFDIDDWSQADWGGARFHAFAAPKEIV